MTRPVLSTFPDVTDPFQELPAAHSGLDFAYGPGRVRDDNTVANVAADTVTLADDTTNYVEVTAAGTVSANTSGFTAGRIPLYTVVTASAAISTVADRRAFLMIHGAGGGGGGGSAPRCHVYRDGSMTVNNNDPIPWNAEQLDTDNFHDNTTNPSRLTIPANGDYRVIIGVRADTSSATFWRLFKNGTRINQHGHATNGGGVQWGNTDYGIIVGLVVGDYLEIVNESGGGRAINSGPENVWASIYQLV